MAVRSQDAASDTPTRAVAPTSGFSQTGAAFVGVFSRGPLNVATRIASLAEFERRFGADCVGSEAARAARMYFSNGGGPAFFVRVAAGAVAARLAAPGADSSGAPTLEITAASPGRWGDRLRIGVAHHGRETGRFDLLVREQSRSGVVTEETYADLSMSPGDPRHAAERLNGHSALVTAAHLRPVAPRPTLLDGRPATTLEELQAAPGGALAALSGGEDGLRPADTDAWRDAAGVVIGGSEADGTGIFALHALAPESFGLLCLPDLSALGMARAAAAARVYRLAHGWCERNFAFLLVDPPVDADRAGALRWIAKLGPGATRSAALYYPRLRGADRTMAASGAVAGVFARTDAAAGVWRAPAGIGAYLGGCELAETLDNDAQSALCAQGVNALRTLPGHGPVVWGARTLSGRAGGVGDGRYIPVRRLTQRIERALRRQLSWAVFEPNDAAIWRRARGEAEALLEALFRQGAFLGASVGDACFARCGPETMSRSDIDQGRLILEIGFAALRPHEFVTLRIQQMTATALAAQEKRVRSPAE